MLIVDYFCENVESCSMLSNPLLAYFGFIALFDSSLDCRFFCGILYALLLFVFADYVGLCNAWIYLILILWSKCYGVRYFLLIVAFFGIVEKGALALIPYKLCFFLSHYEFGFLIKVTISLILSNSHSRFYEWLNQMRILDCADS